MDSVLPTYEEFVELEHKTLKLLHDYLSQWIVFSRSVGLVKQCWSSGKPGRFRFSTHWDVDHSGTCCRIFLGAEVCRRDSNAKVCRKGRDLPVEYASHCICLTEGTYDPIRILRKFHFDYVTFRSDRRLPHPRFHLQYCGGVPPGLERLGITPGLIQPLLPEIDGPRIFFRPMTLGLLMNMAFYEFPCEETDAIRKTGDWQNLVRENEKEILRPYYQKCAELAGKDREIFFDHAYV